VLTLFLFTSIVLIGCKEYETKEYIELKEFNVAIEKEPMDFTLSVYYIDPRILTRAALSVDRLINYSIVTNIVINSDELKEHIDLLKRLNSAELIPVEEESYIDARLYYVFESEKDGKILDVALCTSRGHMFVNGMEVAMNPVFVELVLPFLPEEAQSYVTAFYLE
jgi:hypothetical protein